MAVCIKNGITITIVVSPQTTQTQSLTFTII